MIVLLCYICATAHIDDKFLFLPLIDLILRRSDINTKYVHRKARRTNNRLSRTRL